MRIKKGFEVRTICGENIVISHGVENIDFSKVVSLNASSLVVWNKVIGTDFTVEDVKNILCEEYEVDEAVALADAESLAKTWTEVGLVE